MKKVLFCFLLVTTTYLVNAQTIKKYNGQMSKPEWIAELFESSPYEYNGYYSYYENDEEKRVIHGTFQVNYKTNELGLNTYEIKGAYNHGMREGKWTMKAKDLNGKYSNHYLYQFNYRNGVLDGPFQIYSHQYDDVEMLGRFTNGVIDGNLIIKLHEFSSGKGYTQFEGRVNSKGNPHGIWTEKIVSEKAIPKDITRLYYDGNLVYRREKDLSSGVVEYTQKVSDKIKTPADSVLITDTIINGKDYFNVAGIICSTDVETESSLYHVVSTSKIGSIYPSIQNWNTSFDPDYYPELVRREQAEEQRRKEEQIKEEKRKKEEEERKQREEELRKRREEEARLNAEMEAAWSKGRNYYCFCWGQFEASSKFEILYKEIGLDSINAMLDSISRYEYENYTIEELFTNNPDYRYYVYNVFLSDLGRKKKKKINKVFKTYETYIQCKKEGLLINEIRTLVSTKNLDD